MTKLSVCLLTYNRAGLISQTIETILNQTLNDFELIINDNCSSDETESICREFMKHDNRISYYRNEINIGLTGNYQAAYNRSSSQYVAFLHDSDLYHPDLLKEWLGALKKFPSAAFVFNSIEAIDFKDQHIRTWIHEYPPLIQPGSKLRDDLLSHWGCPVNGMVMLNRKCVEDVGMFDMKRFPVLGDVDMWMRLSAKFDVAYMRTLLIRARERESNHFAENWKVMEELYQIHHLNISRRYENNAVKQKFELFFLSVRRSFAWTRYWLGYARRGNTEMTLTGGQMFQESTSIYLRLLGKVMTQILLIIAAKQSRSNCPMEQNIDKT
jgi:glycosyltransferase involved in cell wall biosynthesis